MTEEDPNFNEEDRHKASGDIDLVVVGAGLAGLVAAFMHCFGSQSAKVLVAGASLAAEGCQSCLRLL